MTKKLSSKAISKAVPDESVYGGHRSYAGVKRAVKRFLNQAERRDGKELIRKVGREA